MPRTTDWDPARYEGAHGFVWQYGEDLLKALGPQPGERILDLGCGTGQLTAQIADRGAITLGIDSSPAMIAQARQNYPGLKFQLADAQTFRSDTPFDAIFSNAVLHWIPDHHAVAETISQTLRPDGRIVLELGARGNIGVLQSALDSSVQNYFPSLSEFTSTLEDHGLEVTQAVIFDRPTTLEGGESGLRDWIETFRPDNRRPYEEIEAELRPKLFRDGKWVADYRRLRVMAHKL